METPEGKAALSGSSGFEAGFKLLKQFRPIGRKLLTAEWAAARRFDPQLLIYHPKAVAAPHIAERLTCPAVLASPLPGFTPTREFASPLVPFRSLGPLNRLTHSVMAKGGNAIFSSMIAGWRINELGLTALPPRPQATLYGYSPEVLPPPQDWPSSVGVTGEWRLDEPDWQAPPELKEFLRSGEPPVYVGFGSMPGLDPRGLTSLVAAALLQAGKRGIVSTGGGALEPVRFPTVLTIDGAPHEHLFPAMSACVHHGGAGTTASSLRAGKPTIICSFFGDQPFWGRRVRELGVGPPPLQIKNMTADGLASAITEATSNPQIQTRAAELGIRMSAEDGVAEAIAFLRRRRLLR